MPNAALISTALIPTPLYCIPVGISSRRAAFLGFCLGVAQACFLYFVFTLYRFNRLIVTGCELVTPFGPDYCRLAAGVAS